MRCQPGQRLPAARSGTTSLKGGDHRAGTERPAPVEADSDALQANTGKTEHHGPAVIEQRERFADAHPSAEALQDCTPKPEAKYPLENSASANGLYRLTDGQTEAPLKPMKEKGLLQQHDQRRRAFYTLGPTAGA